MRRQLGDAPVKQSELDGRRRRFGRLISSLLLAFLLVLTLVRAVRLFHPGRALDGHREEALPYWYRDPSLAGSLRSAGSSLRFGEIVWVTVPPSGFRYEPNWFKVMANYAWPYQTVLGVSAGSRRVMPGVTIVDFQESGSVRILRPGRAAIVAL
jgi:hypothetical protein